MTVVIHGAPGVLVEVPALQYECAKCGGLYAYSPFTRCAFHSCPPARESRVYPKLRLVS